MSQMSDPEQIEVLKAIIESLQATVISLTDRLEGTEREAFELILDGRLESSHARMLSSGASDIAMSAQTRYSKWLKKEIGFPHPSPSAWTAEWIWHQFRNRLRPK